MVYKFKVSAARSKLMRKIKSDKTAPEILLQRALRKENIRFRKNSKALPGKPDIVLGNEKIVIFVDGEFWHGYLWERKKRKIKANRGYWIPKIEKNIQRDKQNNKKLRQEGWKVIRFWQQQIIKGLPKCIKKIKIAMQE
ncbi:MAG TPA: very short patch repair endonuclease [Atribacter sp.]|uniref:very short patch repair endonuclease n=1 Tax=Atribacter sp. TaxID=2847780 RepID=UPI002CCD11BD|nr:very short patch repair endonuclease [Atribacter sp.]HQK84166.1 very short patch repair endonuclease [Atribacter sp.]